MPVCPDGPAAPGGVPSAAVLRRASWISFWCGILMLLIKVTAWHLTRSAAILSDAAESVVHVAAVAFVVYSLRLSQKPPDSDHPYGHAKIAFFSAGFEGALIAFAAIFIFYHAVAQWIAGTGPQVLGLGILLTALALVINGGLGWYLIRLGRKARSIVVEANGHHVLTDAWTSIGVLVGLGLVALTGWQAFDPICAIVIAANLFYSGFRLMWRSANGLMDRADPEIQTRVLHRLDEATRARGLSWHQLRHRHTGDGHWVDFHLLFPDETTVRDAHALATEVERCLVEELGPGTIVTTHLEPSDDHSRIHEHPWE